MITYFDMTDKYKSPTVHAVETPTSILVSCNKEFLAEDFDGMVQHYGLAGEIVDWDYWEDGLFVNYRIYRKSPDAV